MTLKERMLDLLGIIPGAKSREQKAFTKNWLDKTDEGRAVPLLVLSLPLALSIYYFVGNSTIVHLSTMVRRGCLTIIGVCVAWFVLSHLKFVKKWFKPQWLASLIMMANLAVAAVYAYSANQVSSSEINMYSVGVKEGKKVIMAASPTMYDVVISSTYFLSAAIIVVFTLPVHGFLFPLFLAAILAMGFFGYAGHEDKHAWYGYITFGCLGAGLVTHRMQFKTRKEAVLELKNRELVAKQATMKLERDLELAHQIQSSMDPPSFIDFSATLKVKTYQITHEKVGGDWFAVRETKDGALVLLIADATGKGIQAALVVHAIQSVWASTLDDDEFNPEEWLEDVNRTLVLLGRKTAHTATLGIIVIKDEKLTYYSAGHCPVYVVDRTETKSSKMVRTIQSRGNILGLKGHLELKVKSLSLPKDKSLDIIFASDGIFEALPRKRAIYATFVEYLEKKDRVALEMVPAVDDKTLIWVQHNKKNTEKLIPQGLPQAS